MDSSPFQSPSFYLAILFLAGTTAALGFVALWATASRVHWFWRAAALLGSVMALVPIRAYEPALVFAIGLPMVIGLVLAYQWLLDRFWPRDGAIQPGTLRYQSALEFALMRIYVWPLTRICSKRPLVERGTLRFGLRDVLLGMVLVGAAIVGLQAIAAQLNPIESAYSVVKLALAIALPTALAYCFAAVRMRWLAGLVLVIAVAWASMALQSASDISAYWRARELFEGSDWRSYAAFLTTLVCLVMSGTWLVRAATWQERPACQLWARVALTFVAPIAAVGLAWFYLQMFWLTPFPPSFYAEPNHYARILELAKLVFAGPADGGERARVHQEVEELLNFQNFIPFSSSVYEHEVIKPMRELAKLLDAEGDAAAAFGEFDRAAEPALANLRLGTMLRRGGDVHIELTGTAIVGLGLERLAKIRGELSPAMSRRAIEHLARSDAEIEPFDAIRKRHLAHQERLFGWQERLDHVISEVLLGEQHYDGSWRLRTRAYSELLKTDLAIRMFEKQNGRLPASFEELVPNLLTEVTIDPYSGNRLIYRAAATDYLLYSVGIDGIDDGGRFGNWRDLHQTRGFDLDLEISNRPL